VHPTWGEPPAQVKERIGWIRSLAEPEGRPVRFGIRLHAVSRDTSAEAWATAHRLLDDLDADTVAGAQSALGRSESVGQQRMLVLHGGAGTGPVGSHPEVADRTRAAGRYGRPDDRYCQCDGYRRRAAPRRERALSAREDPRPRVRLVEA
jgi:alkanesulfonate monooxygenase SsuD/methylene tetrahydromethanopterin reductase-like flavin-dependent oxidoreductase (luciferase family)